MELADINHTPVYEILYQGTFHNDKYRLLKISNHSANLNIYTLAMHRISQPHS